MTRIDHVGGTHDETTALLYLGASTNHLEVTSAWSISSTTRTARPWRLRAPVADASPSA
jgi:hypothetical protein